MEYTAFAKEVLSFYNVTDPEIDFIRYNENMTFKITDRLHNKCYLLRIHKPATEGLFGIQHTLEGIESEMKILVQLNQNSILKIQRPVANNFGEYVTDSSELIGRSCYSTLLEWIDGATLTQKEDNINEIAFKLGENLALLHQCLHKYKPNENFVRPTYDKDRIDSAIDELKYCVKIDLFSREDYEIIKEVLTLVKNQIKVLDLRGDAWGIIHADIQPGNIIINNDNPCLIDFGFCGFGYYLFDLGSAGTVLESSLRKTFLSGYATKSSFTFDDIKYIEGLIFMDTFVSYPLFMRDNNTWIKSHASKLCNTLYRDFLEGREVFYSL